jgi:Integrase core domain
VDLHSRKQYLDEVRKEYVRAGKARRGKLLDEARRRTRLNRKYLIRILKASEKAERGTRSRRSRRRTYGVAVLSALVEIWEMFDYPCGQRLEPVLKQQVERLRRLGELRCSDQVGEQLQRISAKTIDRMLAREKRVRGLRRNRNPGVRRLNWERVPVKVASEWDTRQLGNLQVDFVAHCGRSTGGDYIHTLSAVDIASGWWEGQAIRVRSQQQTKWGLEQMRPRFPFALKEIHPDNDSAMINDLLLDWCRETGLRMSRSRPYKKNDNAWVEQKNWTHVRKVVGYRRYDSTTELRLLNEIYTLARLYHNFFQPALKLREKIRVGGRIKRVYEKARTPLERLLTSGQITKKISQQLRAQYEQLNPAQLRRELQRLQVQLEQASHAKGDVVHRPAVHGPAIWVSKWRRRRMR